MRGGKLARPGQVEPDLEEFQRIGGIGIKQWEHFGMLQAAAGSHPLHIAVAVAPGGAP